ncbi:hypothetical protein NGM33_12355 [Nocardiopsis dassonvillei]|uniref:hypothetical protein n=1 Tax=Nocardiopsis dassonvillei TaxID=2014 RepID=UPI0018CC03E7|nr:hypothetical protein [Nocardiopsis dassonvillei]MCP3014126.1 hypothetical protein [Nocardiopsis dassonvillei]
MGLLAGVLALGPALGPGYVLRYDMVFVPDLSLGTVLRGADGFPRAIPSDAVAAALSAVLPGDAVQSLALLAVFAVGGAGAARLVLRVLPRGGAGALVASAAAGTAYVWNPFVAERLLLGQWAMLLGYAGLPWVVGAAVRLARVRPGSGFAGLVRALVPAAVGGFSSVVLTALTAGPVALTARPRASRQSRVSRTSRTTPTPRDPRRRQPSGTPSPPSVPPVSAAPSDPVDPVDSAASVGPMSSSGSVTPAAPWATRVPPVPWEAQSASPVTPSHPRAPRWWGRASLFALALVVVSLPWLLPSLASGAGTDPAGVAAFSARSDTPFGVLGSLLLLGGVWNSGAVPSGYGEPVTAAARLLLCLLALAGWVWLLRRERPGFGPGLSAAAALGLLIALLGATGPGRALLVWLVSAWPGFGPLRDGQLYVAPLSLVQALGLGACVWWLAGRQGAALRTGLAVFVALLPVVVLPGLLWGASGRLAPVDYPGEWLAAQEAVAADDRPGAVLVLPWSAYRGPDWSGRATVVLDPATKLFDRRTLWNDDLVVGTPDGGEVVVTGEDARARRVAGVLGPDPETGLPERLDAAALGGLGVRYVAVSAPADNQFWSGVEGLAVVVEGPNMVLLRVRDQHVKADKAGIPGLEVTGGLVTVGAIIWSMARSGSSLVFQRSGPSAGSGARKEIPK